jgi:hypothetical protein
MTNQELYKNNNSEYGECGIFTEGQIIDMIKTWENEGQEDIPTLADFEIVTVADYIETEQAEPTNRLLQDPEKLLTEWYGFGAIAGQKARATYMTGPEDDYAVGESGGDASAIDWYSRLSHIDILDDNGDVVATIRNSDYVYPDPDWEADYKIAFVKADGTWDIVEDFKATNDDEANDYAEGNYPNTEWYVLDSCGNNINC